MFKKDAKNSCIFHKLFFKKSLTFTKVCDIIVKRVNAGLGITLSSRNLKICDDAGGGRPQRREISAEYVRFKTGRSIFHL